MRVLVTYLPGTTIEADLARGDTEYILNSIFSMGGLVLSQVSQLAGLATYDIQNWVRRGFLSSPVAKKYSRKQFCRIILINMLKECLEIGEITKLLSYLNGRLDDENDDMIDDDRLYVYLVRTIQEISNLSESEVDLAAYKATQDYQEPFAGGRERLRRVLAIMAYAYFSTTVHRTARRMLAALDD